MNRVTSLRPCTHEAMDCAQCVVENNVYYMGTNRSGNISPGSINN